MNKSFIKIGNSYIIESISSEVEKIFQERIIVTNNTAAYDLFKNRFTLISDIIKNIGPLGGIYSALEFTKNDAVFFIPCDMPFINRMTIERVLKAYRETNCDALVPRIGHYIEPLLSVYKKNVKDQLQSFIKSGQDYSIKEFLKNIDVHYMDLENNESTRKVLVNINSKDDLENAKKNFLAS